MDAFLNKLRFSADLERAFIEDHARRSLVVIRAFFGTAGAIVGLGALVEWAAGQEQFATFIMVALAGIVPVFAITFALTFWSGFLRWMQPILVVASLSVAVGILYVWHVFPGEAFRLYGPLVTVLIVPLVFTLSRLRFYYACATAWAIVGLFLYINNVLHPYDELAVFQNVYVLVANLFAMLAGYYFERTTRRDFLLTRLLEDERNRTEAVLTNIVPEHIASRLKDKTEIIADLHENVVVLFADIVDFTKFSAHRTASEVVQALDDIFTELDALAESFDLEKIKTIGDAYMVVAGLPNPRSDDPERVVRFAFAVQRLMRDRSDGPLQLRVGIHCGPVVAGVIGRKRLLYDLWGDTVNTASRMESTGLAGGVQVSETFAARLGSEFEVRDRGVAKIKGKGAMRTFLVLDPDAPEPVVEEEASMVDG